MTTLRHRLSRNETLCRGATMGQDHLAPLLASLRDRAKEETVVELDFAGIEFANSSYLRATFLRLLRSGTVFAKIEDGEEREAPEGLDALNVFPVASNISSEVLLDLDTLLRSERLPLLVAEQSEGDRILSARRMGHLDPALEDTLTALAAEQTATATALCERYPKRPPIKPPAWSNRLSDLNRLRLARRQREGRQWRYVSIVQEVQHGR